MARSVDLSGKRYGYLTVLDDTGKRQCGNVLWHCLCDCGNTTVVPTRSLTGGDVISCGCNRLRKSRVNLSASPPAEKLGLTGGTNLSRISSTEVQRNNSVGAKGVSRTRYGTYVAYLYYQGKRTHLGTFATVEEAANARKEAEESVYGCVREQWLKNRKQRGNSSKKGE